MATSKGLQLARQNKFYTAAELGFMVVDPAAPTIVRTDVGSDGNGLQEQQTWAQFMVDGDNLVDSTALVGKEGSVTRTFMPTYRLMENVWRGVAGLPISDTLIDGGTRRKIVWIDPDQSSPAIETVTGYYGVPEAAARMLGGKVRSFNIDVSRGENGGQVSGNIEYHFNAVDRGVYVPKSFAYNSKYRFGAAKAVGPGTFSVKIGAGVAQNVVLLKTDTAALIKGKFEALAGAPVVNVVGDANNALTDNVFEVEFTTPANTLVVIQSVAASGWAYSQRQAGSAANTLTYLESPRLLSSHWRSYAATDLADLASIDYDDLPDLNGNDGDIHLLLGATTDNFSMADLWKGHYTGTGLVNARDFVAGARTVAGQLIVPNDESDGSDCKFLYDLEEGCSSPGFWKSRVFACGGYEYIEDVYMGRGEQPSYDVVNDVWMRGFPLMRRRNPEGGGSQKITLILPVI